LKIISNKDIIYINILNYKFDCISCKYYILCNFEKDYLTLYIIFDNIDIHKEP
jgi:hypothetical protein